AAQAQALWAAAEARLQPLVSERKLPLAMWLERLAALWLNDLTTAADWRDDPAGRSVLMALRLEAPWNAAPAWRAAAGQTAMTLDEFIAWADEALEEASYVPPADPQARVVITPLARAMLRPFVAAVCPGADDRRLGSVEVQPDLFGPAVAEALGVEGAAHQQRREALAFVQLLRLPRVTLLRREADGVEPVGHSPLVERLRLARAAAQSPELPRHGAQPPQRLLMPMPVSPPLPRVPLATGRWPASLSASAVEALRDCPYRFYSRVLLGLSEPQELDVSPDKRDYGLWLHAVLMRFHEGRAPTADLLADSARLSEAALAIEAEQGLAPGDLLPFRASFEALAPAYLVWLHAREAEGLHWWLGEAERRAEPPEWQGVGLHGRLDRVDHDRAGHVQVLDYKTGSTASLKTRVAEPLEDTQLAFYAALVLAAGDATPDALSAAYLALDDRAGPQTIAHADIAEHAQALLQGLAVDLERLRAGAPLQALGQGPVCDFCEARGLCRRDHWAPPETPLDDAAAEGEA
ncbi:MAG TPA: PD-(D/E)XK nuclease family protein, partial [Ideonella sp.]|nr:PD-(D/E)XK nuclease family protein [Ideonella sp.]